MIEITPRFLSKVIKGAKKQGLDTKKLESARIELSEKDSRMWTSRKCKSFKEIERIFDDNKVTRPWRS